MKSFKKKTKVNGTNAQDWHKKPLKLFRKIDSIKRK